MWSRNASPLGMTRASAAEQRGAILLRPASRVVRVTGPSLPAVIELAGGVDAPAQARRWMLSCLGSEPVGPLQSVVALIVRKLVPHSGAETVPHLREPDDQRFEVRRRLASGVA